MSIELTLLAGPGPAVVQRARKSAVLALLEATGKNTTLPSKRSTRTSSQVLAPELPPTYPACLYLPGRGRGRARDRADGESRVVIFCNRFVSGSGQ
jgi:hypothetical protein